MAKSNLVKLATGGNKKVTPVKKEEKKVIPDIEKKLTPEEERDKKAKETVKNLLDGVNLNPEDKKEDLFEINTPPKEGGDIIWLQEQVALLSSENQNLQNDLQVAKIDYTKIFNENQQLKSGGGANDDELKKGILRIFHEIQSNYMKNSGFTTQPTVGTPNFVIVTAAFLNRMIQFFPFLVNEKRFK